MAPKTFSRRPARAGAAALLAVLLLAACEPAQPEFGQCAPGVEDIGRATTVLPPGC